MNKAQLIAKAARKGNITQREVRQGLDAVIEVLVEHLRMEPTLQ